MQILRRLNIEELHVVHGGFATNKNSYELDGVNEMDLHVGQEANFVCRRLQAGLRAIKVQRLPASVSEAAMQRRQRHVVVPVVAMNIPLSLHGRRWNVRCIVLLGTFTL